MSFRQLLERFLHKQEEELSFLSSLEKKEGLNQETFRQLLQNLYERRKFRALFRQSPPSFGDPEEKEHLKEKIEQALLQEEVIKTKLVKLAERLRQKQKKLRTHARHLEKYRSFSR